MATNTRRAPLGERLKAGFQRFIQTRIWRMDIAPSAWIATTALIDRTFPKGVHIEEDVYVGDQAVVLTHDFSRHLYLHTRIGKRCHLGARAIIMPGLTLGDDCVVAPGALVTRDMPANSYAIGNPAAIEPRTPA